MKKKMVLLAVELLLVMIPLWVRAGFFAGSVLGSEDESMSKTTLNGASITCPKTSDGKYATCYIGIRVTSGTAKSFKVDATLNNMTYDSYEELNGWSMKSPSQSGNDITFEFSTRNGVNAGNTVLVAGITYKVNDVAQECSIQFTNTSSTEEPSVCTVNNGKYYCKNAEECSKEQYDKECTPENPHTGSFIPYVVVLGGIGIAGAFYLLTRKK